MRIVFLGTGGYHPNERRHTSGVLLPELGLLLDAGTGTFRVADRLERSDLTIALTHAHLDHICGLTYLVVPLHQGRIRSLCILGRSSVLDSVREHLFSSSVFPVLPAAKTVSLDEAGTIPLAGDARLAHFPLVSHPGESCAYRVEWLDSMTGRRRSLAYVTDTTVDGNYTEFIRGVDVLIHECYFSDAAAGWAQKTGHSHTSMVARLAREADVGQLHLTHIDPQQAGDDPIGIAAARAIFPRTFVAEDLQVVCI